METMLGLGLATGMFYHAPAGTQLPAYPAEELSAAWKKVGDVSDAGITLTTDKSTSNLKNWANKIKRVIMTDHSEKIKAPIMDTTVEALKTVLGSENVITSGATSTHGNMITASLSSGELPAPEAFLFLMKDGDDMIALGCRYGQIMSMDDVTFAPNAPINWVPTITALGDGFIIITDDGEIDEGGVLTGISITTPPTKTAYSAGETFDPAGMVVKATYTGGAVNTVSGYTLNPSGALASSNTSITVSYSEGGVTKTATQAITVS